MNQTYLNESDPALDVLQQRIFDAGAKQSFLTYTELVENVEFNPKSLGAKYFITEMHPVNVALIGEYLDYISSCSQARFGFLASALVVSKIDNAPGPGFYVLAKELSLLSKPGKNEQDLFWISEVQKAYAHYGTSSDYQVI